MTANAPASRPATLDGEITALVAFHEAQVATAEAEHLQASHTYRAGSWVMLRVTRDLREAKAHLATVHALISAAGLAE